MKQFFPILLILAIILLCRPASAQHWSKIFDLSPTMGSAAFFFNPSEGLIGTGNDYPKGNLAQIFYTLDGGVTWKRAQLPNMQLIGQVTDIYFTDRQHGWATIKEAIQHGWSGVYRSTDGGVNWQLAFQAEAPGAIREVASSIIFTDRRLGIRRSVDGGKTFITIAQTARCLGLDFYDDLHGIVSSEGSSIPFFITSDGGVSWQPFQNTPEAWSTYGDPINKRLFFGAEGDPFSHITSSIGYRTVANITTTETFSGEPQELTGGIAGSKDCHSAIYVQKTKSDNNDGFLRSTDAGQTWQPIDGPIQLTDKRFAVTGHGAVVYAFDALGGVWKTSDGGDGTLASTYISSIKITPSVVPPTVQTSLCDSSSLLLTFRNPDCDSATIINLTFLDDSLQELSGFAHGTPFSGTTLDSIRIKFKPAFIGSHTQHIKITFRESNGFLKDSIIAITTQGRPAQDKLFIAEAITNKIDFGSPSICNGDSTRIITVANSGCAPMTLNSITVSGAPFLLASSFSPITIDPGISRKYLLRFKPSLVGPATGYLIVETGNDRDSIVLSGLGKVGDRGYSLQQTGFVTTVCDSTEGDIFIRNTSCNTVVVDSITIDNPFTLDGFSYPAQLGPDSMLRIHARLKFSVPGTYTEGVHIHSAIVNDIFDTTISITGTIGEGAVNYEYSPSLLSFDTVTFCMWKELEVTIKSTGCDTLEIPLDSLVLDTTQLQIVSDASKRRLLAGDSITVRLRYHPSVFGPYSNTFRIKTNVGFIDIPITAFGSNDPGVLTISTATLGSILTCNDTTFSLTLTNTTCDLLALDSIVFSGAATDYSILSPTSGPLPTLASVVTSIKFSPQVNGQRPLSITYYLHKVDGSIVVRSTSVQGVGIQPPPIGISLPSTAFSATAGQDIHIPVLLLDSSYVNVKTIELTLGLRTDLLSPVSIDLSKGVFADASVQQFMVSADSLNIGLQLSASRHLSPGTIGDILCQTYVTDTTATEVQLIRFDVADSLSSASCLPLSQPTGVSIPFTLLPECGTMILTDFLHDGTTALRLLNVMPNPAHSELTVTVQVNPTSDQVLSIEVLNDVGVVLQQEQIPVTTPATITKTLSLNGPSGGRTLRLRNGSNEIDKRFVIR